MEQKRLENARALKSKPTPSEQVAWEFLRDRRMLGLKFRRQQVLGPFVADFYCDVLRLVLEIDGGIHECEEQRAKDEERDIWMQGQGLCVLRIRVAGLSRIALIKAISPFLTGT